MLGSFSSANASSGEAGFAVALTNARTYLRFSANLGAAYGAMTRIRGERVEARSSVRVAYSLTPAWPNAGRHAGPGTPMGGRQHRVGTGCAQGFRQRRRTGRFNQRSTSHPAERAAALMAARSVSRLLSAGAGLQQSRQPAQPLVRHSQRFQAGCAPDQVVRA